MLPLRHTSSKWGMNLETQLLNILHTLCKMTSLGDEPPMWLFIPDIFVILARYGQQHQENYSFSPFYQSWDKCYCFNIDPDHILSNPIDFLLNVIEKHKCLVMEHKKGRISLWSSYIPSVELGKDMKRWWSQKIRYRTSFLVLFYSNYLHFHREVPYLLIIHIFRFMLYIPQSIFSWICFIIYMTHFDG